MAHEFHLQPNITSQALIARSSISKRPFILPRAFYAVSQRFGAMWTGDNFGTREHMAAGVQMVLANGIAGMTFGGCECYFFAMRVRTDCLYCCVIIYAADVGGFFGNPEREMLVRWYQVGGMQHFFRAHAHIDTKRREPYLLEDPYKSTVRDILRLRCTMLPIWYTAFRETSVTGIPVLRYVSFVIRLRFHNFICCARADPIMSYSLAMKPVFRSMISTASEGRVKTVTEKGVYIWPKIR